VENRALLKLPDGCGRVVTPSAWSSGLRSRSGATRCTASARSRTPTPALRRSFERVGRYLGLVGLLSLLWAAVGVAQVARAWLAGRMDDIAVLAASARRRARS
jgi:predicted lysophospholipase L1 biosynthesis ABC-type transport system permease subunit